MIQSSKSDQKTGLPVNSLQDGPEEENFKVYFIFIALHVPLAFALYTNPYVGAVNELLVLLIGIWAVSFRPKDKLLHILIIAYIAGGETLWRMTGTSVLTSHEFGKYSAGLLLIMSLWKNRADVKIPFSVKFYLLLLLPSTILILFRPDLVFIERRLRDFIATQIAFTAFIVFFRNSNFKPTEFVKLMLVLIAPILATMVISAYHVARLGNLVRFGWTSAQFTAMYGGVNQMANALALGAVACWLLLTTVRLKMIYTILIILTFLAISWQMLVSLSRGGVFTFTLVVLFTLPLILKTSTNRLRGLLITFFITLIIVQVIWPKLTAFTTGSVNARYEDIDSPRWKLAMAEFEVWQDHPLFGTGPGFARFEVYEYIDVQLQAHVEFTRYLAEHGMFGLIALIIVFSWAYLNYIRVEDWRTKVWVLAFIIFTFGYWGQAATRTIAPSFAFGLSFIQITLSKSRSKALL